MTMKKEGRRNFEREKYGWEAGALCENSFVTWVYILLGDK